MCLYKTKPNKKRTYSTEEILNMFKTAKRTKTVYKCFILKHLKHDKISLRSPYQEYKYHLGQKYTSKLSFGMDATWRDRLMVNQGIHAYVSKNGNMNALNAANKGFTEDIVVIPCIIPVGAKYLIGTNNEIVTDTLILPDTFQHNGEKYTINY